MGVNNFESIVSAKTVGTQDVQAQAAAMNKLAEAIEGIGKKADKVNQHPGFAGFAAKVKAGLSDPLGTIEQQAIKVFEALGPVGGVTAGVGAALGVMAAAGFQAAKSLAAYGQQFENLGLRTGLTTKEVAQFGFAARLVDQDVTVFERTMRGLNEALTDASAGGDKARQALKDLGVAPRQLNGELKPTGQLLREISAALNALPNTWQRNEAGMAIFKRAWVDLAPAILKLNDGIRIANQQGFFGPSEKELDKWDEYDRRITTAEEKFDRFTRKVKAYFAENFLPQENYFENLAKVGEDAARRGLPQLAVPAPGRSAVGDALFGGDATRLNAERAEGNTLLEAARTKINATLEGLRLKAADAKKAYEEAYGGLKTLSDVGATAAQKQIDKVSELKSTFEKLNEQLKLAEKLESARLALIEKAADLRRGGSGNTLEGFLQFGEGAGGFIVTQQQIAAANRRRPTPSLFGTGPNPFATTDALRFQQEAAADLKAGLQPTGDFVSPSADRASGTSIAILNERWKGYAERRQRDEAIFLANNQAIADASARLIELRAGPGGELQAARETASVRQNAIEKEYQVTGDIARYREESKRNELDLTLRIAELEKQRLDNIRNEAGRLFDALLQGPRGLQQFARDFILGEARKVFQNIAVEVFKGASTHLGLPGKIFQGTVFGQDPLKGATDLLKVSTDDNTLKTVDNTAAIRELTAALQAARAGAVSPSGGGGSFSPAFSTFQKLYGAQRQGEEIGYGTLQAAGLSRTASGLILRGSDPSIEDLPLTHASGTDPYLLHPELAGYSAPKGTSRLASGIGKGVGYAAAGFAAYQGVSTIAHGGAQNVTGGAGALAGAAGGILMLAGVSGPAAPILAGVGLGLGLVSSLFGDPKQKRQKEIDDWMASHRYQGPDPVSIVTDLKGRDLSYDMRGNLRPINVTNVTNNHVSAIDSQDVAKFFEKNAAAVNRGVAKSIREGGDLVPELSSALGLS